MINWRKKANEFASKSTYDIIKYAFVLLLPWLSSLVSPYLPFVKNISRLSITIHGTIILMLGFVVYRFYRIGQKRFELLENSGIFYFNPNVSEDDRKKNETLLSERIRCARTIEIIGATGYNTFARKDATDKAILRDALENTNGEIKILLLLPNARQTRMRATSLAVPHDTYQNEIVESIHFLKELKNKGKNVILKFYQQRPVWKMLILDDFLWLQHYKPGTHVEKVPVYGIERNPNGFNLFDPLYAVFMKKWQHDANPTYDFNTDEIVYDQTDGVPAKRIKIINITAATE